ncbi:MAG: FAD-dependent oxidoreductase [Cyanobacteria bacterium RUI128]|nr:FAD-dependent oxidoreductase [Cyanobacteria bacterium RUI128]
MKIVIIGGVAGGAKAAAKSKRLLPDAQIDVYTQDTHVSYSACGLPYYVQGNFEDYHNLIIRTPEKFQKDGIDIHLRHRVTKIMPEQNRVRVHNLDKNTEFEVEYDRLLIATGAVPFMPDIKGIDLKNVFKLRTLEDGINLREKLRQSKNAVIIGGGYIGLELLEAFVSNKVHTTMIERSSYIMPILDNELSELVQDFVANMYPEYTRIINNDNVVEFTENGEKITLRTEKGEIIETDFVLVCAGVRPVVDIAQEAGITLGKTGAIKVNSRMQTNIKNIYACGDCSENVYSMTGTPAWIPLGSNANKEGRCAAINMCGEVEDFEGVLGSAVTKYFGLTISMTGFTEKFAQKNGYDTVSVMITKRDKAGYMPDAENVTLKLVADRRTHQILGGQAIGCGDADKRINTLSTALIKYTTAEELSGADITYAPPFSTSIDPLISAARLLDEKLKR